MDDTEALLLLGAGSEEDQEAAREHFVDAYLGRLIALLEKTVPDLDAARSGATQAFIEFFEKLSETPDAIRAENEGVWRWLIRAGRFRAADELRRFRHSRRGAPGAPIVRVIDLPQDYPSSDPPPENLAMIKEATEKLKHFLDDLDEGDAVALLQDVSAVEAYKTLTGEDLVEHDEQVCLNPFLECYTSEALRKRRDRLGQRVQRELKEYLP